jgi:hypothetical protein
MYCFGYSCFSLIDKRSVANKVRSTPSVFCLKKPRNGRFWTFLAKILRGLFLLGFYKKQRNLYNLTSVIQPSKQSVQNLFHLPFSPQFLMKRLQIHLFIIGCLFWATTPLLGIPPTITQCPANITVDITNNSACTAVIPNMLGTFLATDNCPTPTTLTYTQSPVAGTILSGHGTQQTVVFTVADNCGESSTCSATVRLRDIRIPTVNCHDKIVSLNSGTATITVNDVLNSVMDNCTATNDIVLSLDKTTFTCADLYASPVTVRLRGTDLAGNTSYCVISITVQDNAGFCPPPSPTITQCPANITLNMTLPCSRPLINMLPDFQATDNCPTATTLTYTQSPVAGTVLSGHGTTQTVTFTATDNCGRSSNCTAVVTLRDALNPQISWWSYNFPMSNGQLTVVLPPSFAEDNCTPQNQIILNLSKSTFTCADLIYAPYPVIFTATDLAGNTSTLSTTISFHDVTNTCPTPVGLAGKVKTESGVGIPNVSLAFSYLGQTAWTFTTNAAGEYFFPDCYPNINYTVKLQKNTNPLNGVSTADATAISNHVATTPLLITSPYKLMAANVTEADSDVSVVDLADNVRLLQALHPTTPVPLTVSSWAFIPANHVFTTAPPAYPTPQKLQPFTVNIAINTLNYDFIGVKKGDVTGDADPNQ